MENKIKIIIFALIVMFFPANLWAHVDNSRVNIGGIYGRYGSIEECLINLKDVWNEITSMDEARNCQWESEALFTCQTVTNDEVKAYCSENGILIVDELLRLK
ncbi:hypothetical protein [Desulfofustis glycolicus]|uniref:hypothetical protein n=1 Tax=Desulfofustis glycolicus TaxID=51195 RepID=UPI001160F88C|nr:hypothetical protein [Desulfofustis glycolicus]